MHSVHTERAAFTLIEMSIVLAIIGLLIGGILVGTSVLRNAELQSVINDYTKYSNAFNQFTVQYGNPPGDLADATSYWGDASAYCPDATIVDGTPGTCNGNGDGMIAVFAREPFLAWEQLQLAKLIPGNNFSSAAQFTLMGIPAPGITVPAGRLAGSGWVFGYNLGGGSLWYNQSLGNVLYIGQVDGTMTISPLFTPSEAWRIDSKMDDGMPATGRVITTKPLLTGPEPLCATTSVDATAAYNVAYGGIACALLMSPTLK